MLENFRRVDVLRKYFNTKILQHSVCTLLLLRNRLLRGAARARAGVKSGRTYGSFSKAGIVVFEAATYIKKYGRRRLERH